MSNISIASLLGAPGPFYRSVSIERDRHDRSAGRSYVLTSWLERSVGELLDGLKVGSTRRAWRIVGDFGVGKSALALGLVQALDPRFAGAQPAIERIASAAGGIPRMYPVVLSGSRAGLGKALSDAIASALDDDAALLSKAAAKSIRAATDPFDALLLLRDSLVARGAFDGLLLVIDEMGKFLETATFDPDLGDIFRLQTLAEQAARSGDKPLAILLMLHQGFQSYAEDGSYARRTEWAKIAERFDELVFDHPLSHTASLLQAALNAADLPPAVAATYEAAAREVRSLGWLGPRGHEDHFACYPIHPATVPVMARFFAAFGQNERSLFGFVASGEASGLRAFAASNGVEAGLYRIDHFFDYVAGSYGHRLVSRNAGGDWDRIRSVLDGADDSDACEIALLKTIGILNLIEAPDLAATAEAVTACLTPFFSPDEVEKAIVGLGSRGLLFERAGRAGLRLWTSRRVDLSVLWDEARRELPTTVIASEVARHMARLPVRDHLLARRHSVERGTSRRFAIRIVAAGALSLTEPGDGADGSVICILAENQEQLRHARAWAKEVTERNAAVIAMVAPSMPNAAPQVTALLQHRWMIANAVALQEDMFASAEIERGAAELEVRLVAQLELLFGLGGNPPAEDVQVYHGGARRKATPPIHILVSQLCDNLFEEAPRVANELINRHSLTPAGAGARQRLIEAIFVHEADPRLGFDGTRNPPERALYLSVVRRGNIHRAVGDNWVIGVPDEGADPLVLRPALLKLEELLAGTPDRVSVTDIYSALAARPHGIRLGLAPLLLAISIAANRHRIALFERGTYCPKVDGPAFMRILKSPGHFELQWVSLEGIRADVFRRLATVVEGGDVEAGMLSVVTPLIRFAADLPFHVHRTTTLEPVAAAVRDALLTARSPVDLIFRGLPLACGVPPFDPDQSDGDRERVDKFIERLESAIAELRGCYPALLISMRADLAELISAKGVLRANVQGRAAALLFRIQEQTLRTFALRLADANLGDDAWIEALGGAVLGKPPTRWLTADTALWRARLGELASAFCRVEAAAFGGGGAGGAEAVRLSLTHVDGREHAVIVDFAEADEREDVFASSIVRMIDESDFKLDRILAVLSLKALCQESSESTTAVEDDTGNAEARI